MSGVIKGFHHVAIKCADFKKTISMYRALGMTEVIHWGEGEGESAMYDLGDGGIIEFFANGDENQVEGHQWLHFAVKVDDVDLAYKTALEVGFKPLSEPAVVPIDGQPKKMTVNIAFVAGPDGEELEFFRLVD